MADFTPGSVEQADLLEGWILKMDRASNSKGAGIRIVLTTPEGSIIEQSFPFKLKTFTLTELITSDIQRVKLNFQRRALKLLRKIPLN